MPLGSTGVPTGARCLGAAITALDHDRPCVRVAAPVDPAVDDLLMAAVEFSSGGRPRCRHASEAQPSTERDAGRRGAGEQDPAMTAEAARPDLQRAFRSAGASESRRGMTRFWTRIVVFRESKWLISATSDVPFVSEGILNFADPYDQKAGFWRQAHASGRVSSLGGVGQPWIPQMDLSLSISVLIESDESLSGWSLAPCRLLDAPVSKVSRAFAFRPLGSVIVLQWNSRSEILVAIANIGACTGSGRRQPLSDGASHAASSIEAASCGPHIAWSR